MREKNCTRAVFADKARLLPFMQANECHAQIFTCAAETELINAVDIATPWTKFTHKKTPFSRKIFPAAESRIKK